MRPTGRHHHFMWRRHRMPWRRCLTPEPSRAAFDWQSHELMPRFAKMPTWLRLAHPMHDPGGYNVEAWASPNRTASRANVGVNPPQ